MEQLKKEAALVDTKENQHRGVKGVLKKENGVAGGVNGDDFTIQSNISEVHESFDNMGLKEGLLRGIYAFGFEKPSAIQQRAIVPCCTGRDVIAQAQSGTGKTATFSVSVLQRVDELDQEALKELETYYSTQIEEMPAEIADLL